MNHEPRFQAYCIGNAKSGTHSLAGLFSANYRAAHEPEPEPLVDMAIAADSGMISQKDKIAFVRERGGRLGLEFDSSIFNFFVLDALVSEFSEARFILLIRDCYSWVDSFINHSLSRPVRAGREKFTRWWFRPEKFRHTRCADALAEHGLHPLDCYLSCWATHIERSLATAPHDRLLTVRTCEISQDVSRIADFLGIAPYTLDRSRSHEYKAEEKHGILRKIDRSFLEDRVALYCKEFMERYFPGIGCLDEALASRG